MKTVDKLLGYDRQTRNLAAQADFGRGLESESYLDLVDAARDLEATVLLCGEVSLCRELGEWLRYRAIFRLLPHECLFGRPREEKPIIREHLEGLAVHHSEELVSAIKALCTNYRARRSAVARKLGISDVRVRYPHVFSRIMAEQGGRCCYCGVTLEYGENATLDHVLPFHLGDDPHDGSN